MLMLMLTLTKTLNWFRQQKVRKFVCFVSCVVGLLCYALSSTFHHLFGKWIWWKILLYILVSFFLTLVVVRLGNASHRPFSTRSKVYKAILVLLLTCVYSYFVDKKVNVKPDAYILGSYAALSIMSLGLSTFRHYGFEDDLLYFFIGTLTIQLMKINLWLLIAGAGFVYSLINLRSVLDPTLTSDSPALQDHDHVVIEVGNSLSHSHSHSQETRLSDSQVDLPQEVDVPPENEDVGLLHSHLDSSLEDDVSQENENENIGLRGVHVPQENEDIGLLRSRKGKSGSNIMERFMGCIETLKKENNNTMSNLMNTISNLVHKKQIPLQQLYPDDNLLLDLLPLGILNDLAESAQQMVMAGLEKRCFEEYAKCRREFVLLFPSPNLKMEDIDNIENIEQWLDTLTVAVRILFPNEMRLFRQVFRKHTSWEFVFTDVLKEFTSRLLSSCHAFATWSQHMDNYRSQLLQGLMRELRFMFDFQFEFVYEYSVFAIEASMVRKILDYFDELQKLILSDEPQATVPAGGLHPITRQFMDYFRHVYSNKTSSLLGQCLEEYAMAIKQGKLSPSLHIDWGTKLLETTLEATSKKYRPPSLGYLFIINNWRFVERELYGISGPIIGLRSQQIIEQNLQLYLTGSWDKILKILKLDINESEPINVVTELMLDKLSSFNQHMDGICNDQSMWFVFDDKLRDQIIKSIKNILLPAYGKFIKRLEELLPKQAYKHIKLGICDVEKGLDNLFLERASESDVEREGKKNA